MRAICLSSRRSLGRVGGGKTARIIEQEQVPRIDISGHG
jgi:hypothetical protein